MTLHFVRLPVAIPALHRWAGERGIGWCGRVDPQGRDRSVAFDEGRALHHLLTETFGKGALQPFRLLAAPGQRHGNLYAYSLSDKVALAETLHACAMPEVLAVCDPAGLEVKTMPENWQRDRRLGFETRVRPVRRLLKACGAFPKGAEVDAFLVQGLRQFPDGPPPEAEHQLTREDTYAEWLKHRLGEAAQVDATRLVRFQRHRAARNGQALEGPDATIQGELTIGDPLKFAERLVKGVGRHTAYGFGMLLIRPAGRR